MKKLFRQLGIISTMSIGLMLTGCTEKVSPVENMYTTLEAVVTEENGFNEQQDPLTELEMKEHELYQQIISLSKKEFDQIVLLSKEAFSVVEAREEKIELERQSMINSKEKFKEALDLLLTIEDENLKQQAEALVETMNSRYEAHENLYEAYKKGIGLDKELYTILQDENLTLEQLETKINEINEAYQAVLSANEEFNSLTKEYNESKQSFYEAAGMEVTVTAEQ